jgi:hypothetical protein
MPDFDYVQRDELETLAQALHGLDLDERQRKAQIHLTEQFLRLLTKQDNLIDLNERIGHRPGWSGPAPTATQQQDLFEATQDFFQTYYATLSALFAFLNRLPKFTAKYGRPNHQSTAKAINWLRTLTLLPFMDKCADRLEEARAFRALLDHPGGTQPYDWATSKLGHHEDLELAIFGSGTAPDGASVGGYYGQGEWHFVAPYYGLVVNALWNASSGLLAAAGRFYRQPEPGSAFRRNPLWRWAERPMPTLPTGIDDPRLN